jgi:tetratricopeptide (TPR) repeat protein
MKGFAKLLFRMVMVAVCCFATWMSIRHARAEFAAAGWTRAADLEHALRIEPENVELVAMNALLKGDSDDPSPAIDGELLRAAQLDPFNSQLLIALGLRAESRGDTAQARSYLARATQIDHSFTPAWALASFSVRNGEPDKFWPMAKRCLSLEPLLFDPRPVFDLAWRVSDDPKKIRGMLPQTGPRLIDYFSYLMNTNRIDPAAAIWPEAMYAFDPSRQTDVGLALEYCSLMAENNRVSNAVRAWNQLVDRHLIRSGRLDPATGASIADPDFSFPPVKGLFGWQVTGADGVFVTSGPSALRMEMDGNEPEALTLLSTAAAVLPHKAYRLEWKYDSSQLSSPHDRGFEIRILQQPGNAATPCEPFLKAGEGGTCSFTTGPDIQRVGIELRYARASGTTRSRGTLVISSVRLGFGS